MREVVDLDLRLDEEVGEEADATLLLLAEGLAAEDLLTLDRRGFAAFRTRDRRALRLVLDVD